MSNHEITPVDALNLLVLNQTNWKPDIKKVKKLVEQMKAGTWILKAVYEKALPILKIVDLQNSPYANSPAKNGFDSVSTRKVILKSNDPSIMETPHCIQHGAMNKVDASGLWRCLTCNVGAFATVI